MRAFLAAVIALALILSPVSLGAWGMDVHRFITARAIDGLPAEIKPFFAADREFIAEHSVDPDLWRVVELKGALGDEEPNHFLDMDALGDPPPFNGLPRDWNAYVAKFGIDKANQFGRLPWRAEEIYHRLVGLFGDIAKGTAPYAADNARYLAAILAHYIEDAHQPFHGSINYDGQATNQRGIHSRFETQLVLRNRATLTLAPVAIQPIASFRDFMFKTLIDSQSLVDGVLAADRQATTGLEFYDDAYFAAFFKGARPIVERRISESASGVASAIVAAWTAAGKPALPVAGPRPPARIRR